MANTLYPLFKQALENKEHNLSSDTIKATLIDLADYTYSASHSSFATDVPAGAKVATVTLTGLTTALGVFDSDDFVWPLVTGDQSEAIILWNDTHASDGLIAFIDTGMTGMPVTPTGSNINGTVNASGWFGI
jgi:hypothetical protein